MDKETFWKLIDETHKAANGEPIQQSDLLVEALSVYPVEEIMEFYHMCKGLMNNAYRADLWDAADIIGCGCSDDGFVDFRAWLIQQGKTIYEAALNDPEVLADIVENGLETQSGGVWAVAMEAYEKKTGLDFLQANISSSGKHPELDKKRREYEENKVRFPKLFSKFGDCSQLYTALGYPLE